MSIPGNNLGDNWFMGRDPVKVATLGELRARIEDFSGSFKLTDANGNPIQIRMGQGGQGSIIIESSEP